MSKNIDLITVSVAEDESSVALEYQTVSGQEISSLVVEKKYLPQESFGNDLSKDQETALVQLLLTPFGHVNLLERWLKYAMDNNLDMDIVKETKALLGIPC